MFKPGQRLILLVVVCAAAIGCLLAVARAQQPAFWGDYVAWSPDGQKIALSGVFGIRLYTAQLQSLPVQFSNAGVIASVAWSPDSSKLASANLDYSVSIWDTHSGNLLINLQGHTQIVTGVSWSPDGTKLASSSWDRTVRIWDVNTGQLLGTLAHDTIVQTVAWSPDGSKLVSAAQNSPLYIWNPNMGQLLLRGDSVDASSVTWSADNQWLLFYDGAIVSAVTGQIVPSALDCPSGGSTGPATWSHDGSRIACAGSHTAAAGLMIDAGDTWLSLMTIDLNNQSLFAVALSPTGDRVAGTAGLGFVRMWNTSTGALLASTAPIVPTTVVNPQTLVLTPLCSPDPTSVRAWRVDNPNPFEVEFDWSVENSSTNQTGREVAPAARGGMPGIRFFTTNTEPGTNTVQIFSPPDTLQDTKDGDASACAAPTPTTLPP